MGHSFAVHVPNGPGRDELLKAFLADARAHRPTRIFVSGRLTTFQAPMNGSGLTGLLLEVLSARNILLNPKAASTVK